MQQQKCVAANYFGSEVVTQVEQGDRDAAADYYYSAGGSPNIAAKIREGKKDDWFRVQAFARHRIAERERCWGIAQQMVLDAEAHLVAATAKAIANAIQRGEHIAQAMGGEG